MPRTLNFHTPRLNVYKASRGALLMFYWISQLTARSQTDTSGLRKKSDDWIDVSSKALRKRFGSRYLRILNELFRLGWIIRGTGYSNSATSWDGNGFSKGIKITDEAVKSGFTSRTVSLTEKEAARFARCDKPDTSDTDIQYAVDQQDSVTLASSYKKAIVDELALRLKKAGKDDELINKAYRWELQALTTAGAIVSRTWWVTKCVGHRVHTPVTSMPGIIRDYLECDGEELVELDISNSQPAILGGYLRQFQGLASTETEELLRLWDSLPDKDGKRMRKIVHDDEYASKQADLVYMSTEWKSYRARYTSRSHYEHNLGARAAKIKAAVMNEAAVNSYCESVTSGKFYQEIAHEAKIAWPEAKKEVKTTVLKSFYEKSSNQKDSSVVKAIESLFGVAMQVLKEIKAESYPAAAIAMTRKESEIMHCDELRSLGVVYVYDALLAKKSHKEEAEKTFKARLDENQIACQVSYTEQERAYYEELDMLNSNRTLSNTASSNLNHSNLDHSNNGSQINHQALTAEMNRFTEPSNQSTTTDNNISPSASHQSLSYSLYVAQGTHDKGDARHSRRTKSALKQHTIGVHAAITEYTGTEARPPPWK